MNLLIQVIFLLIQLIQIVLLVYVITTWVLPPYNSFRITLANIFEPVLAPLRNLIPPMGGLDFSVLVLFVILYIITNILAGILR
jgi:YggT family protein